MAPTEWQRAWQALRPTVPVADAILPYVEQLQSLAELHADLSWPRSDEEAEEVLGESLPPGFNPYARARVVINWQLLEAVDGARRAGLGRTKFMDVRGDL